MAKKHYIPVTSDVPGADSKSRCAFIRKVIRTALAAEGVTAACEVDVLLTDDVKHPRHQPGHAGGGPGHGRAELSRV